MTLHDVHDDGTAHEFVTYTDGSATMTEKWPREAACEGWGLAILHRSAAGQLTWCGSLSAPIYLGNRGTDVLGPTRLTNNAAELTELRYRDRSEPGWCLTARFPLIWSSSAPGPRLMWHWCSSVDRC